MPQQEFEENGEDEEEYGQQTYESHRSLIDPRMKQRLNELVQTAKKYKTKACGMQKLIGLQAPASFEIEM